MNNSRLYALIGGVVIVAILLLGWVGLISPQLQQISSADSQIASVNAQNQVLAQTLITLKDESDRLPELTAELAGLREQIPDVGQADSFVNELQALAADNGVELSNLTVPEAIAYPATIATVADPAATDPAAESVPAPVPTDLTTPVTTTPSTLPTDRQPSDDLRPNLYTINVTLSIAGPPSGLVSFLKGLQSGTRVFLVTTTSLNTQAPDGLGNATIGGYLFIVDSPEAAAARTATDTPAG